jgi:hypothetical protein
MNKNVTFYYDSKRTAENCRTKSSVKSMISLFKSYQFRRYLQFTLIDIL